MFVNIQDEVRVEKRLNGEIELSANGTEITDSLSTAA